MEQFIQDILIQIACYVGLVVFVLLVMGRLQRGFLKKFIVVKGSFGKYKLIRIIAPDGIYWEKGQVKDNLLVFKLFGAEKKPAISEPSLIYPMMGIQCVDYDTLKGCFVKPDMSAVSGYDNTIFSNLLKRALTAPRKDDKMMQILLIIGVVTLLAILFVGFNSYQSNTKLDNIQAGVDFLKSINRSIIISTGGI